MNFLEAAYQLRDVDVERDTLLCCGSLCYSHRDTKDGVCAEFGLVLGTIELVQEVVNCSLVLDIDVLLNECRSNRIVDDADSFGDTWLQSVNGLRV